MGKKVQIVEKYRDNEKKIDSGKNSGKNGCSKKILKKQIIKKIDGGKKNKINIQVVKSSGKNAKQRVKNNTQWGKNKYSENNIDSGENRQCQKIIAIVEKITQLKKIIDSEN